MGPLSVSCPVLSATLVNCGQTVGRMQMKLGTQVGLAPGHIVLTGDPAPPPPNGHSPPNFLPISVAVKWLHGSKCHLDGGIGLSPGDFVLDGDPAPSIRRGRGPFPNFRPISIVPKRLDASRIQDATWYGGSLSAGDFVLDGDLAPLPKKGQSPQFLAHVYCGQSAAWMPLGTEIGLGPGHIVLDGDPAPVPKKGPEPPIFGPFLLWPNGWMHQDATWCRGRPQPRRFCVRWGLSPSQKRGGAAWERPIFGPRLLWPNGCMDQDSTWYGGRPRPTRHSVIWGPSSPSAKGAQPPNFRPMSVVAKGWMD